MIDYANLGGRVFATHFSYTWLYNIAPWSGAATWNVNQAHPNDPLTGLVDTTFPRGMAFSQWAPGWRRKSAGTPLMPLGQVPELFSSECF